MSEEHKQMRDLSQQKSLCKAEMIRIDTDILIYRKDKSLNDIFNNFFELEALENGIVMFNDHGNGKQKLFKTCIVLENILGEKVWPVRNEYVLYVLIYQKVRSELKILDIEEELLNECINQKLDKICFTSKN